MSKVSESIKSLQYAMDEEGVDPRNGLPLDLFEFTTSILPFVNVDLIVQNHTGQILLSWRDDIHYGSGWQIPGGIIRMMETIEERIQKTAIREIGCEVEYDKTPIIIFENIIRKQRFGLKNQFERAHNIALLYSCKVPDDYMIDNHGKTETDEGFLKWFNKFPADLLDCHKGLRNYSQFQRWF